MAFKIWGEQNNHVRNRDAFITVTHTNKIYISKQAIALLNIIEQSKVALIQNKLIKTDWSIGIHPLGFRIKYDKKNASINCKELIQSILKSFESPKKVKLYFGEKITINNYKVFNLNRTK